MATREGASMKGELQALQVNVRVKISALWAAMLFVWVYVDIFSFFRPDVRAEIEAGEISGFTIGEPFLLGTTVYILIPSLMVFGAMVLGPRVNRMANIALAVVYAITIGAGAVGEWGYYILGSGIEIALLAAIAYYAWTWPKQGGPASVPEGEMPVNQAQPVAR